MRSLFLVLAMAVLSAFGQMRISISPPGTNGWVRIQSYTNANSLVSLEGTTNFTQWRTVGVTFDNFWNFADPTSASNANRLYRLRIEPRVGTNDWKNELIFPNDGLRSTLGEGVQWVKFAILLSDPTRVYFQDSTKFPFHFDFASQRLGPFVGMPSQAFDAVSLYRTNQQVVLGTVLFPDNPSFVEFGVQFVGKDVYAPEEIARWFELVRAAVYSERSAKGLYMPVFEQMEMARTNAARFEALGAPVGNLERWISVNHVYSPGWAVGRLKFFRAGEISAAYGDGRLTARDILLTDGVPAETPLVAGIISLTPSTPNSHTAILSQSFGIPFVYLPDAVEQVRVQGLVGRKIVLRARSVNFYPVRIFDVNDISPEYEAELAAVKLPKPIEFAAKEDYGAISASTEILGPGDIKYFGGKAANYGILRDAIPSNCPPAIAFSFRLWDQFSDQVMPGGQTLRALIAGRLGSFTNYPPDIPSLKTNLAAVRDLIRQTATFSAGQKQAIISALGVFDPNRKIRFRSSTNVEDSENFTGAGLYDSYSGCLQDDLDGDETGPSICDPEERNERGVFRAIQRVFASFYNDNAFLERLRHGVDESKVGMGVLVHHSFPDEEELANGVATLRMSFSGVNPDIQGTMVTQLGANSVSNPDGSSTPEVVDVRAFGGRSYFSLSRNSSLVPLGGYVMKWDSEYRGMFDLMLEVGQGYRSAVGRTGFYLDFEYKKDVRIGLAVKQVREIPAPVTSGFNQAYLVNEPTMYCVAQGEFGNVFANHRLKSVWNLQTESFRLVPTNMAKGIFTTGTVEYLAGTNLANIGGTLNTWPRAERSANGLTNVWFTGSGAEERRWTLNSAVLTNSYGAEPPIYSQRDFNTWVTVKYSRPMPAMTASGAPTSTTNEMVLLEPCPELGPGALLRNYVFTNQGALRVETSFYWPKNPQLAAGYTAPLVRFVETKITGLTTAPIVLRNYYSQTYHPFHHNFVEEFIFDPWLEPGLSPTTMAELQTANVRLIYARKGSGTQLQILGLDEAFRTP